VSFSLPVIFLPVAVDFLQHHDYAEFTNIIGSLALNLIIFTGVIPASRLQTCNGGMICD